MTKRNALAAARLLWALSGVGIAGFALRGINADAFWLVTVLYILGPLAAMAAAMAILRGRNSLAVALLVASLVTPTYFVWVVPVAPIGTSAVLVAGRLRLATRRPGLTNQR
jgi:hypothetical protein